MLCNPVDHSTPGFPVHHQLPEPTQTLIHWVSDAIQPSHPLSFPSPPTFNLSQHQSLSNESVLHLRWPKDWSFSFSVSPSNQYWGLISFRMDWLDLLAGQFSSVAQSCPTLCDPMNRSTPGIHVHRYSWSLLKLMSIESVMPSNHLILCHPLLLLLSIFPSIKVFSSDSVLPIRWPQVLELQLQLQSFQWIFRTDFL